MAPDSRTNAAPADSAADTDTPALEQSPNSTPPAGFPIVGIGASAGGLQALERFFEHMPDNSGAAFVVIQHLSPDFKSLMKELLERRTQMTIKVAAEGVLLEANTIFLIPPGQNMAIANHRLHLTAQDRHSKPQPHFPIDLFFESLGKSNSQAIAIVLSGTGSDGSRGIQTVSEAGGIVMVQDPDTAEFDGMPYRAIETGVADLILAPQALADAAHQFLTQSSQQRLAFRTGQESPISASQLQQIINILESCENIDFSQYKRATLNRRISRRAILCGHHDLESYIQKLRGSAAERANLRNELLITVTRFFRNTEAWNFLAADILPALIARATAKEPIRIWITACATGEEAYSAAMLVQEQLDRSNSSVTAKIFATDIDAIALAKASSGIYTAAALADLSPERRDRFFKPHKKGFEVVRSLRETIIFANHNLVQDAVFTNMDLVSCRNVLIYMQPDLQQQVLQNLHFSLKVNGTLFLGESENLGNLETEFSTQQPKWKIYQKNRDVRLPVKTRLASLKTKRLAVQPARRSPATPRFDPLIETALSGLLQNRQATCFLVDRDNQLLHLCSDPLGLLNLPVGRASQDAIKMLPESLQFPLSTALYRATQKETRVIYKHCQISEEAIATNAVTLEVSQQKSLSAGSFSMVIIEPDRKLPTEGKDSESKREPDEDPTQYVQIQQELHATRESLQATIEELEATNEEQQSTNEELTAANEELQSTNEELHSVNEEMHTVNTEYQSKIQELVQLNRDLDNLLNSLDIGVIFLDKTLKIRQFNPAATLAFNLLETDIGRPLNHLAHNLAQFDILETIEQAQQQTQPIEQSVQLKQQETYLLLNVYSCVTDENAEDGWILTTVNVNELKRSQTLLTKTQAELRQANTRLETQVRERTAALRNSEQLLQSISKAAPNAIYIYDLVEHRNRYANTGLERLLGYSEEEMQTMEDSLIAALLHPDDISKINAYHQSIISSDADNNHTFSLEYRIRNAKGNWQYFYSQDVIFARAADGTPTQILGTAIDISDYKTALNQIEQSEARYRALYQRTPVMMHSVDAKGIIINVSQQWLAQLGYQREEVIGKPISNFLIATKCDLPRRSSEKVKTNAYNNYIPAKTPPLAQLENCSELSYRLACKNGEAIDVQVSAVTEYNERGQIDQVLAVMMDVTERNKTEFELAQYREHLEDMVAARSNEIKQANQKLRAKAIEQKKSQNNLAKYTRALERSNASLEEFAYVVSHDLQEPLRAMTVFSQLLEQRYRDSLNSTAIGYLDHIVQGGTRMQALIDGILDFSRITHHQQDFHPVDLQAVLDTLATTLQIKLKEAQASLSYSSLPTVLADRNQITQVFQNLIGNAIKFRGDIPIKINIEAQPLSNSKDSDAKTDSQGWLISVQDNGIGIPEEQQSRIFTLFQRLHTRQEREGYGIGLSICKKIVERHQGRIWVESEIDKGSTFYFTLEIVGQTDSKK